MAVIETISTITALIPVITSLVSEITTIASTLKDEGYEVPSIEKLQAINEELRALEDL